MTQIDITAIENGVYRLFSIYDKESIAVTSQGLLEIAMWIDAHRTDLEPQKPVMEDCLHCRQGAK